MTVFTEKEPIAENGKGKDVWRIQRGEMNITKIKVRSWR